MGSQHTKVNHSEPLIIEGTVLVNNTPMNINLRLSKAQTSDSHSSNLVNSSSYRSLRLPEARPMSHKSSDLKQGEWTSRRDIRDHCATILRKLTDKEFTRDASPSWLLDSRESTQMYLSCYNEELKLALEYNDRRHYVFPNPLHKNLEDHLRLRDQDELKVQLCRNNGVYLIVVPYVVNDSEHLQAYIEEKLPQRFYPKIRLNKSLSWTCRMRDNTH